MKKNFFFCMIVFAVGLMAACGTKNNESQFKMKEDETGWNTDIFVSDRDTSQYKECLYRLKQLVDSNRNVPAKVLIAAVPKSKEEYHICDRLTYVIWETEGGNQFLADIMDLDYMLWQYVKADSVGAMEAYMLMGEFSDGCVGESEGDHYIELEKKYPLKFAEMRKERSKRWNDAFERWKAEIGNE